MDHPSDKEPAGPGGAGREGTGRARREAWERWLDAYGPTIACALEEGRRYRLVRIGSAVLAFSSAEAYVAALKAGWDAGFAPEPLGWTIGSELPERAPRLAAVDPDLAELPPSGMAEGSRRLPPR